MTQGFVTPKDIDDWINGWEDFEYLSPYAKEVIIDQLTDCQAEIEAQQRFIEQSTAAVVAGHFVMRQLRALWRAVK